LLKTRRLSSKLKNTTEREYKELEFPPVVKRFLESTVPLCTTIVLGGSWASGKIQANSDVDLCLICHNKDNKRQVLTELNKAIVTLKEGRKLIDAKVFTEAEFQSALHSTHNLFLFSFFQNSLLLYGADVSHQITLLPHFLKEVIWATLESVKEAINYIEHSMFWTIACYKLWASLTTFFIANKIIQNKPAIKTEQLSLFQNIFGSTFSFVKQNYEKVRLHERHQITKGKQTIRYREATRIPKNIDQQQLLDVGVRINSYGDGVYRRVLNDTPIQ
jgi:predicted nucleotidyltransferase